MIELKNDRLVFRFSEVHPDAELTIHFQRTLRIPDDGKTYPLPAGLGAFPLRHVDDFAGSVPGGWLERGGVMLPMYQAEAMWLNFSSRFVDERASYCFVVKIATGKINAVSGEDWSDGKSIGRDPQNYVVVLARSRGSTATASRRAVIRQFVAMPLGAGYSAEEQLTGEGSSTVASRSWRVPDETGSLRAAFRVR